jgi:hypothetical protein
MRNLAERMKQPMVFIRFKEKAPVRDRYKVLVHWVREAMDHGPREGDTISVLYLFYDGFDPSSLEWKRLL